MSAVWDLMTDLLACLTVELEKGTPVCWAGVAPGDGFVPSSTGCDSGACGEAWVRLASAYPSTQTGRANVDLTNCTKPLGFDIELGIARCFAVNNEAAPEDPNAVAQQTVDDMLTIHRAVVCCASSNRDRQLILGIWTPAGPLGGVAGGTWPVHVGMS